MPSVTGPKRVDLLTLGNKSIKLREYDEDTQREYIQTLAHMYKRAQVDDPQFIEICQGRAEPAAKRNELFSTCGEFAMFLLHRAGYRGPALNRDIDEPDCKRKWRSGKNIEYLFFRGRKEGAFIEYLLSKNKNKRPQTGDIVYIANDAPSTEHVFYFDGIDSGLYGEEVWVTIDGGQGGRKNQHIKECTKYFDQDSGKVYPWTGTEAKMGSGRRVIGWLNPILLEFTAKANLRN